MVRNFIIFVVLQVVYSNIALPQKAIDYINYQNKVNDVELLLRKQCYLEAIFQYKELQNDYPVLFVKDLHNLSICYLKTNQLDSAICVAKQLVLQGRTIETFDKYEEFRCIADKNEWKNFVEVYPSLRKQYERRLDRKFISMIDSAIISDQSFQKISDEKRDSVYYYQGKILFDYIFDNGFPDFFRNEEEVITHHLFAMLRHFFYLPKQINSDIIKRKPYSEMSFSKPYDDFMLKAVKEGKLLPATYELIMYHTPADSPYGFVGICFDFDTETVSMNFGPQNTNYKEINERRKSIGLALVDSTDENLEGTWYKQVSFKEMKEAYRNCNTCKSFKDYLMQSSEIRERVRKSFRNEELKSFIFSFDPENISIFQMKGSYKYMPNLRK